MFAMNASVAFNINFSQWRLIASTCLRILIKQSIQQWESERWKVLIGVAHENTIVRFWYNYTFSLALPDPLLTGASVFIVDYKRIAGYEGMPGTVHS